MTEPISNLAEGLTSPYPSSPTMRKSTNGPQSKRHAPEFSRSLTKRRRLVSLANANEDLGSSRILHVSDDYDDAAGHDELSAIDWQDDNTGPPPPPSSDRPVSSMRRSHGPDSATQHTTTTTTTTNGSTSQLSRHAHAATTDALLPGRAATGQKVRALANALLTNPPRSARPSATDTQDAAARVAALHEDYKTLDAKLQLATARLSEQLLSADPAGGNSGSGATTAAATPASLRPGSSMPVAVHVDEDDAVASALSHIANLEARRAGLLARLHMAQAAELDVHQQRSGRQLAVQVDNARVFRRVLELGPSGVASLLRVLLASAGVRPSDGGGGSEEDDAADAVEAVECRARIRQALDDDLIREGLLPGSSRGVDRGDGPTDLIDLGDTSHIHDEER
ncbi:hypothetical protein RB594_006880 [Gaeumannomyces avenae]